MQFMLNCTRKAAKLAPICGNLFNLPCGKRSCQEVPTAKKMIIKHEREKLINAAVYFAENTENCGIVKLFKLLYFLDFEHYKEIGRSVTGLEYYAWKMGPVPEDLYEELPSPEPDLAQKIKIQPIQTRFENPLLLVVPKAKFDPTHFTRRELRLLEQLSAEFYHSSADQMIEATHVPNRPWHRVYMTEGNRRAIIPYDYVLPEDEIKARQELGGSVSMITSPESE